MNKFFGLFGKKLSRKGKCDVKVVVLIPYILYLSKLRFYYYSEGREGFIYGVQLTPFFGFSFLFGRVEKQKSEPFGSSRLN
ncbi:MAG: hypothetical protein KJ674_05805 [Nanoarchaeota archaeon]|nr:hypothetical protein [Nanoarchaeota archaeon]